MTEISSDGQDLSTTEAILKYLTPSLPETAALADRLARLETKLAENQTTGLLLGEILYDPKTPASGQWFVFAKANDLFVIAPSGTTHSLTSALGLSHTEDHDHDGTPTQKLIAANTHESVATDTHHANAHTVASHSDTTGTGAELNTLTSAGDADALHTHPAHAAAGDPHTGYRLESADHSHATAGAQAGKISHDSALNDVSADDHHAQSHTLASHSAKAHSDLSDAPTNAHHTKYTDAEVDAIVLTHKNLASDHHSKYTDAEVDAIVLTHKNLSGAHHTLLHAAGHADGGADTLDAQTVKVAKLIIDDSDASPIADVLMRVVDETMQVRKLDDTDYRNFKARSLQVSQSAPSSANDTTRKDYVDAADTITASQTVEGHVELATPDEAVTASADRVSSVAVAAGVIQKNSALYGTSTTGNDTYVVLFTPTIGAYRDGMVVHFKPTTGNTGACTLEIESLGAKPIVKKHDQALVTGDIEANQMVHVQYDGTSWQMLSQLAQDEHVRYTDSEALTAAPAEVTATQTTEGVVERATDAEAIVGTGDRVLTLLEMTEVLQAGSWFYKADGAANDSYLVFLTPQIIQYTKGMEIRFEAQTANTGACTLNVNSLGAKTIKKLHDQDLADNDIESGQMVTVIYDGTNFQMQSQIANAGAGHTEDHDHDGSPTQKLLAANTHETTSASTHHARPVTATSSTEGLVEEATDTEAVDGTAGKFPDAAQITNIPSVRVISAASSLNNATMTSFAFNSETWDTDGMHSNSTNNGRLTATHAGKYMYTAHVRYNSNSTGVRLLRIRKNSTGIWQQIAIQAINGDATSMEIVGLVDLSATEWIDLQGRQDSGGSLSTSSADGGTSFTMTKISA